MEITLDMLPGGWSELKETAQQKWIHIGAGDFARLNGKMEKFAVLLGESYGYSTLQRQIETEIWVQDRQEEHSDGRNRALTTYLKQGRLYSKLTQISVQDSK